VDAGGGNSVPSWWGWGYQIMRRKVIVGNMSGECHTHCMLKTSFVCSRYHNLHCQSTTVMVDNTTAFSLAVVIRSSKSEKDR
jgi:hypothetical protein